MSRPPPSGRPFSGRRSAAPTSSGRRSLLGWLGLGALGAAVAQPAAAFQVLPPGDYATRVETGCGNSAYHRRLLENAEIRLGVTLSEPQMTEALAALRCPACGCPLLAAAAAPPAETPPPTAAN